MKKKTGRIWVISNIFYPSQTSTGHIMTQISLSLSYSSITIITNSKLSINDSKLFFKEKFQILRLKFFFRNNKNLVIRLLNDIIFSLYVFYKILFKSKSNDKIFAVTNPSILLPFLYIIKKLKKNYYTLLVHDVFPDNLFVDKRQNFKKFQKILKILFNKFYNSPDMIIAIGYDMKKYLSKSKNIPNSKIKVIPNWFDPNIKNFDKKNDKFLRITYAGNIGRMQGLLDLLKLISKINKKNNYTIDFHGDGPIKEDLIKYKNQFKLNQLIFNDSFDRKQQSKIYEFTDIALVCLRKGMYGLGVPSKVYNAMAAGLPILYVGDIGSEIDSYIKKYNIGWSFNWEKTDGLISFLENISSKDLNLIKEKGKNSLKLAKNNFSMKIILKKYQDL